MKNHQTESDEREAMLLVVENSTPGRGVTAIVNSAIQEGLAKDEIDEVRRIVRSMLKDLWRVLYSKPNFWSSSV